MNRKIIRTVQARATSDGAGVNLSRVFGGRNPEQFDPFLMLDEFGSDEATDYIAGFPSHPHRGFETVTYMLNGRMLHEDHMGNKGLLEDGDVQWMSAARGIIHSEMPQQKEGLMRGFQLWVNLPASEKMKDPSYRDIPASDIPELDLDKVKIKVIAGDLSIENHAIKGAVSGLSTDPTYLDIHLQADAEVSVALPDGHTTLLYVYENKVQVGDEAQILEKSSLAILTAEGNVKLKSDQPARVILLAGKPLREPIAQYGPFVMNTSQEIEKAIQDFRDGSLVV